MIIQHGGVMRRVDLGEVVHAVHAGGEEAGIAQALNTASRGAGTVISPVSFIASARFRLRSRCDAVKG